MSDPIPKPSLDTLSEYAWRVLGEGGIEADEAQQVARAFLDLAGVVRRAVMDLSVVEFNAPLDYRTPITNIKNQLAASSGIAGQGGETEGT